MQSSEGLMPQCEALTYPEAILQELMSVEAIDPLPFLDSRNLSSYELIMI